MSKALAILALLSLPLYVHAQNHWVYPIFGYNQNIYMQYWSKAAFNQYIIPGSQFYNEGPMHRLNIYADEKPVWQYGAGWRYNIFNSCWFLETELTWMMFAGHRSEYSNNWFYNPVLIYGQGNQWGYYKNTHTFNVMYIDYHRNGKDYSNLKGLNFHFVANRFLSKNYYRRVFNIYAGAGIDYSKFSSLAYGSTTYFFRQDWQHGGGFGLLINIGLDRKIGKNSRINLALCLNIGLTSQVLTHDFTGYDPYIGVPTHYTYEHNVATLNNLSLKTAYLIPITHKKSTKK